uniref:Uncharacterized protein n=1 Tax=Solanum tuberosum TaxID=4113 RepID=M1DXL6_SOLTU
MIETEEEWCTTKTIVPDGLDYLEKIVASPRIMEEYANVDGLGEEIGNLFEEGDVAPKKMMETPGIRDAEPIE